MPHIRLDDREIELSTGELRIGTGDEAQVRLDAGSVKETLAIVVVDPRGTVTVRRVATGTMTLVNGVALGAEPAPLLHGDRIEVAGRQLRFSDDRKAGSTVVMPAFGTPATLAAASHRGGAGVPGGRVVSLVDGREYLVPPGGLRIGLDASSDDVVPGPDVSRNHAELALAPAGDGVRDVSANGVFVNGARTGDPQPLRRGDAIRIGTEEFRFYSDAVTSEGDQAIGPTAAVRFGGVKVIFRSEPDVTAGDGGTRVIVGLNAPHPQPAPAPRPIIATQPASDSTQAAGKVSPLVWIAAAVVIGATVLLVIQDR